MSTPVELRIEDPKENSDTLVIEASLPAAEGTPIYATTAAEAGGNRLAKDLIETGVLDAVLMQGKTITLLKPVDGKPWQPVVDRCRQIIETHFDQMEEQGSIKRDMSPEEKTLALEIQEVFNLELNPMVASHGGFIEVLAVNDDTLYIHMGGGCQGCSMSTATLKQGVETLVLQKFTQITHILDTTDHAAGTNPFFTQ
jgi:Fe-S cluster biogenesis protein NfuA